MKKKNLLPLSVGVLISTDSFYFVIRYKLCRKTDKIHYFCDNRKQMTMAKNDWKDRLNIVYSTNPDFQYSTDEKEETETLPKQQQKLRVSIEKNHRGGKTVTVIKNFIGSDDDLKELARLLKTRCGVGGSAKDGEILIQGDFKPKVIELLKNEGYTQTK